ncbi:MAG: peroxide stress protein YaaA [Cyanobacteria bacterium P01_A01_bin.116]
MLMVISPAKTLDYSGANYPEFTVPAVLKDSEKLVSQLSGYDAEQLSSLMKISDKLANLNQQRFQDFQTPFTPDNAKQALLVFKGDVYRGMSVADYTEEELSFAQDHLRILSGLYGVLRPLDLMQPYRLEMGTKLATDKGKNLYEFWGNKITELIDAELAGADDPCLVNLASNEYFKSINRKALKARVLNIAFKENKNDVYKIIAIHAKRARGLMADFVIRNQIDGAEGLKGFDREGYTFRESLSDDATWVFCRD